MIPPGCLKAAHRILMLNASIPERINIILTKCLEYYCVYNVIEVEGYGW